MGRDSVVFSLADFADYADLFFDVFLNTNSTNVFTNKHKHLCKSVGSVGNKKTSNKIGRLYMRFFLRQTDK
ncbi:hypothetical protein SAMN05444267_100516 [Chryseobacterium polytrichastri]|uniref:Uncharacterized protein n=2 Tax=Chryseobacterium polytrichastri TaxID=1302687 RepID=A0A1M6T8U3_9FLAO|nr:hypothetical protein SAMN05444267_100516 [Chryseobacterium polytrichastri]